MRSVNWCPGLGTVLANEEVTADGRSERGNFPVYRRPLKQWMLRITAYADRLIDDLDRLDWPESVKPRCSATGSAASTGARVRFALARRRHRGLHDPAGHAVRRHLPGAGPGAPAGRTSHGRPRGRTGTPGAWTGGAADAGARPSPTYRSAASRRSTWSGRPRAGTRPASSPARTALNPVNGEQVPIFVADYVLMGYGTGAIMAVPAQDQRDWSSRRGSGCPSSR